MMHKSSSNQVIEALREIVGASAVLTDRDASGYEQGARYGLGRAACVVRPSSVHEISRIVQLCARQDVPLVVQGANTGLVGSSTPDSSGTMVVLSIERLTSVCEIDHVNMSVTTSAGIRLSELNVRLQKHGLQFPIDLGADPTIGGMIATNTGGTRLIRYGDVRHNVLALEVVLFDPPGEIVQLGRALRKDNTGFDLKQLFIGSSGAVGVVTAATLVAHRLPVQVATALVAPMSAESVPELLLRLVDAAGEFLSAFEFMSSAAMEAAIDHVPGIRSPFSPAALPDIALLIELQSSSSRQSGLDLEALLESFLGDRYGTEIQTAIMGKGEELWKLRHSISEGARKLGKPIAFDISVARSSVMQFRREAIEHIEENYRFLHVVDFGHYADGGLHFNLVWPNDAEKNFNESTAQKIRSEIYELVVRKFSGSFSAEHGVGPFNIDFYRRYSSAEGLRLSGAIQDLMNPQARSGALHLGPQE